MVDFVCGGKRGQGWLLVPSSADDSHLENEERERKREELRGQMGGWGIPSSPFAG
jgi:hypothetical protein